jgi:hypothetical protein
MLNFQLTCCRTYPTVYVAYLNPSIELLTPQPGATTCEETAIPLTLPASDSSLIIYPSTDPGNPTPGAQTLFSLLDGLPAVTSAIGGNPGTCYHGTPTIRAPFAAPNLQTITHTSVSVLTKVGNPVTLAQNPFGEGGTTDAGTKPTPEPQNVGTQTPAVNGGGGAAAAPTQIIVINGATVVPQSAGTVIINGQTVAPGKTTTLANGVPVSVANSGGVVIVGSSTVTVAVATAAGHSTAASSGQPASTSSKNTGFQPIQPFGWRFAGAFSLCIALMIL